MTSFGIALVVIGATLVCCGLILRPGAMRPDATGHDEGLKEMRVIISALEEKDRAESAAIANVHPRLDE
jgi:hypothetical protein